MACAILVVLVRLHRAGRVVRGRSQARAVGGGWREGLGRPLPLLAALGASLLTRAASGASNSPAARPQPYPATLMVGFYATASSEEPLRTDLDNELEGERPARGSPLHAAAFPLPLSASPVLCLTYAMYMYAPAAAIRCDADPLHPTHGDPTLHRRGCPHTPEARWFARDEVLAVLNHTEGTNLSRQDHKELAAAAEGSNPHAKPDEVNAQPKVAARTTPGPTGRAGPLFKIPPRTAIGGVILCEWAYGRAGPQPVSPKTANL